MISPLKYRRLRADAPSNSIPTFRDFQTWPSRCDSSRTGPPRVLRQAPEPDLRPREL